MTNFSANKDLLQILGDKQLTTALADFLEMKRTTLISKIESGNVDTETARLIHEFANEKIQEKNAINQYIEQAANLLSQI